MMWKLFIYFGLASLLASCGWSLRGNTSAADQTGSGAVTALSLGADDIYTPLYRVFKMEYEKRQMDLSPAASKPQLKLLHENISNRTLSLDNALDPAENEITFNISYQITLPNQLPQLYHLQLYRTFTQNINRPAARDNEKEQLIDEMRHEAAERVLNQIRTLSESQHSSNTP